MQQVQQISIDPYDQQQGFMPEPCTCCTEPHDTYPPICGSGVHPITAYPMVYPRPGTRDMYPFLPTSTTGYNRRSGDSPSGRAPTAAGPAALTKGNPMEMQFARKWYTPAEVAAMLGFGLSKTKLLIAMREIRSVKVGAHRRILPEWVDEYVASVTARESA